MTNRTGRLFVTGACIALLWIVSGCASCKPGRPGPPGQYNIEVTLDDSLKSSSVIVDLVGANPSNFPRYENCDMGKYWKDGDPMRNDADKVVLNFVTGQALTKTMEVTNAHWNKWKSQGVTHVLVLADLPGAITSRPGNQDPRRQILSLDRCNWPNKTTTLKVLVQRSGIVVQTPVRATR
jgi:hypothetical protein